jgi:hypothetical protein
VTYLGRHAAVNERHERPLLHDELLAARQIHPQACHLHRLQVLATREEGQLHLSNALLNLPREERPDEAAHCAGTKHRDLHHVLGINARV